MQQQIVWHRDAPRPHMLDGAIVRLIRTRGSSRPLIRGVKCIRAGGQRRTE
jgi:hypothetical protein